MPKSIKFTYMWILAFLCSQSLFSLNDEAIVQKINQCIQKKDYLEAAKVAEQYIKNLKEIQQSDRIVKYYFYVESNLDKLDLVLDTIYRNTNSLNFRFHALVFILIEKSLLTGDYTLGTKWGAIYKKHARSKKKKYYRGLYFYACHLYKQNEKLLAMELIEFVLREKPKKNLKDKLTLLKILHYKNEYQFMVESKNFIKKNPDSNYVDFVFVNMIQNVKNTNIDKYNSLRSDFFVEHKDSMLYEKVNKM